MRKILILIFLCTTRFLTAQTERQLQNIEAFNRLYGYVKYFHPSDEAANLDWNFFAFYGSKEVENCGDDVALQNKLIHLFQPIAPTLKIIKSSYLTSFDSTELIPPEGKKYKTISWQHLGEGLSEMPNRPYLSARLNRKGPQGKEVGPLFERYCKIGEYIKKEIGSGLTVIMPLALYGNDSLTYPKADPQKLIALENQFKNIDGTSTKDLYVRIGDLIITWNIFQHFYPYFNEVKITWTDAFRMAIKDAYANQTEYDFLKTVRKFTAKLNDGHIWVRSPVSTGTEDFVLPIQWEWVENKLVITEVLDNNLSVKAGDIVETINQESPKKYFQKVYPYISAATPGWLHYRAQTYSIQGPENSKVILTLSNKEVKKKDVLLTRDMSLGQYYTSVKNKTSESVKKITDNIYYINIGVASMEQIKSRFDELKQAKALICDLRGYPNNNHELIGYLLQQNDTSKNWMRIPKIIYPDQENITGYMEKGWTIQALSPHLDAKIFFIIDGQAISYAESYLSFIEHYNLGTLIGQPSAGTNGVMNSFTLWGSLHVTWTGMKVVKHDGSQHHGVGIIPDVKVERTIKGVREQRDEFLNKAIELAAKVN